MKKILLVTFIVLLSLILIVGCQSSEKQTTEVLDMDWDTILEKADGQKVNLYMWGGSSGINSYFKEFIKPRLQEKYNVNLNPVPVTDIKDIVNKISSEKQAGNDDGSVDIMWINGENFKIMKSNDLLYGDVASKLPNFNKYIKENPVDFQEPTEGLEVPFGKAQFVYVYDEEKVESEIKTLEDLENWIIDNPGRFTYPAVPDFTGSAFIRHFYYKDNPIERLNAINPYLWREGETYPNSSGALDTLYSQGEVDFTMSYTPFHCINKVKSGEFPKSSKTLILEDGTLSNTHFMTVPYNAPNKAGALVAINYLISFEAQFEKMKPSVWGDLMVLKNETLSENQKQDIQNLIAEYELDLEYFESNRIDEFSGEKIEEIENTWTNEVLEK